MQERSSKPRVSFFVHNLSDNAVVRVAPLAQAIARKYEVEVLGFLFGEGRIHEPHRGLFAYKTIRTSVRTPEFFRNILKLGAMATGDIIYACKPLMTSFAPALCAARLHRRKPLFLDVDDDDWQWQATGETLPAFIRYDLLGEWSRGTSWKYTMLLHAFTQWADGVTVVSRRLQRRYGGELLRGGPDEHTFDPARYENERRLLRERWGLPAHRKLLLFAGTPRPHKGLDVLAKALTRPEAHEWELVLLGPEDHVESREVRAMLGKRCHLLGYQPYARMAELLAAADAVPLPQKPVPYAQSQVPAKLLDALAMARPIVASRVGDLPEILGRGRRGWLVEPERPEQLAAALAEVADRPEEAQRRGRAGRAWFLQHASSSAIFSTLDAMFTEAAAHYEDAARGLRE